MFDARTLSRLEKLFDLQMWAFGCDARRAEGNLFAVRGMSCCPPPAGSAVSSTWNETFRAATIELSSAGVKLRRGGSQLLLQRGPLGPQLRGAEPELVSLFASWVLEWEAWVDLTVGLGWRPSTLAQRKRPAPWNVKGLRAEWLELSESANRPSRLLESE
jgi:hypothetical protein